ncbi:MAG: DNA/RNA non-specific endonuclease [Ignavibacteriales bacterium]|nr:MAG: DNA/RNA non-specific endonuclease [Ignavibacteriales bacterium]
MADKNKAVDDYRDRSGYQANFIANNKTLHLPDFSSVSNLFKPSIKPGSPYEIPYQNFSVILNMKRKFPLFTACNINGSSFQDTSRKNNWRNDPRAKSFQWGSKLYSASKSDFDKGHMTRREDPAWGNNLQIATKADQDTFHYTNAVPQIHKLNGYTWKELEDHVLHSGAVANKLKISVFTGPVLDKDDPEFVTKVSGTSVLIPDRFWKVIVWDKKGKGLHAVGFVMSQKQLLVDDGIVKKPKSVPKTVLKKRDVFENIEFKDRKSYQVSVSFIEKITGIKFNWKNVKFPFTDTRAIEIKSSRIKASTLRSVGGVRRRQITIQNMVL